MRELGEPNRVPRSYILLDRLLSSRVYRAAYYVQRAVLYTKLAILIVFLAIGLLVTVVEHAHAAPAIKPDFNAAYHYALKCFVAGIVSMPKPEDDPDGSLSAAIDKKAKKAFDTVYLTGSKIGYGKSQISADLDHAQALEMRVMVQRPDYLERTKADCVKLGLM